MAKGNRPLNHATQSLQFQMALDDLRNAQPFYLEQLELVAAVHWKRFEELQKAGFTEAQALEIVCKRPLYE